MPCTETIHWLSFHLALFDFLNWTTFPYYSLNILISTASNVVCKVCIHSPAFYTAHFLNLNEAILATNAKCWTISSNYNYYKTCFLMFHSLPFFLAVTLDSRLLSNEQVVTLPIQKVLPIQKGTPHTERWFQLLNNDKNFHFQFTWTLLIII